MSTGEANYSALTEKNKKQIEELISTQTELVNRSDTIKIKDSLIEGLEKDVAEFKEVCRLNIFVKNKHFYIA